MSDSKVTTTASALWAMHDQKEFTEDVEAHYKTMLNYLDILNYMNANIEDEPVAARHIVAFMAYAMPSLAYVDPSRTREISYNLHLVCRNIKSPLLVKQAHVFNADNVLLVEEAMACGLYRLVSGRELYAEDFHGYAQRIYDRIRANGTSSQNIWAIDTISGRYEVYPNVTALMALELHDRFYGTKYGDEMKSKLLGFIQEHLLDKETGLYYEYFQTGVLGYANETVRPESFWHTTQLKASINGLALAFLHYYLPEETEKSWKNYKAMFRDELLALDVETLSRTGSSYQTQLAYGSEDISCALLAAREFDDPEFFDLIQSKVLTDGDAQLSEGHIYYPAFGDLQHLICHFLLFARTHTPWKILFSHPWEQFYGMDYNKVR